MSSVRRLRGRLIQIRGPAAPKLLSPKLLCVCGTAHMLSKEDWRVTLCDNIIAAIRRYWHLKAYVCAGVDCDDITLTTTIGSSHCRLRFLSFSVIFCVSFRALCACCVFCLCNSLVVNPWFNRLQLLHGFPKITSENPTTKPLALTSSWSGWRLMVRCGAWQLLKHFFC